MELHVIDKIIAWHYSKNLIEGATDLTQSSKMLEETIELIAAQMPDDSPEDIAQAVITEVTDLLHRGKIKTVKPCDVKASTIDAVGDLIVVGINILVRNKVTVGQCLEGVFAIISKRTGSMIKGSFVKDE